MRTTPIRAGLTGILATLIAVPARADVLHVDADAPPGGDGLAWKTAFTDLQNALAAAAASGGAVTEIWVAAGTYVPGPPDDATTSFLLRNGLALYGGFDGTETSREQRDWTAHESRLSGDVGRDDVITSWPDGWSLNTPNCGHVVDAGGCDATAILDGFTVADGHTGPAGTPAGDPLMWGGGVYCIGASPTIRHCTFTHNLAAFADGGAIYVQDGDPVITDCRFIENYAHLGDGAGIATWGTSAPVIEDCSFERNRCIAGSGDASGGGIAHAASAPITVARCTFVDNLCRPFYGVSSSLGWGAGLWNSSGGTMTVVDCDFRGNDANFGGGFFTWGPATVIDCCFTGNKATPWPNDPYPEGGGSGAAAMGSSFAGAELTMINCTIAFNTGKKYAVHGDWNLNVSLRNCILWHDVATHPEVAGTYRAEIGGNFDVAHSCVEHIFEPPGPGEDPLDPGNLPGCIQVDPQFVEPGAGGDLRLAAGSPALDAGDNAAVPAGIATDLDGAPRFVDDPAPDTGAGSAPLVDMGAYERGPSIGTPGDVDGDGDVDVTDLVALILQWGPCPGCPADLDGNDVVDVADLVTLILNWT